MPDASLALFADLGACHVQKSSVTICVLPAPFRWRATPLLPPISMRWIYFYPRPPCGGRRAYVLSARKFNSISIHALRVEGDPALFRLPISFPNFYPRPPGGGRLTFAFVADLPRNFYPRSPGGGRRRCRTGKRTAAGYFYPRPPGGGRPQASGYDITSFPFLSTPSGWRATRFG